MPSSYSTVDENRYMQAYLLHQQDLGSQKDGDTFVPILVQTACLVLDEQHRHQSLARA